jgi:hypothetical protein
MLSVMPAGWAVKMEAVQRVDSAGSGRSCGFIERVRPAPVRLGDRGGRIKKRTPAFFTGLLELSKPNAFLKNTISCHSDSWVENITTTGMKLNWRI